MEKFHKIAVRPSPDKYLFESIDSPPRRPMGTMCIRNALRCEFEAIGIIIKKNQ